MVQGLPAQNDVIGLTRGSTDQAGAITGTPRREAHHHGHLQPLWYLRTGARWLWTRPIPEGVTAPDGPDRRGRPGDERDPEPHTIVWCRDKKGPQA